MKELEANVRSIEQDGLVWGGSKLVAVGFGIKKLQINLVIEDDKISLDALQQQIEEFEDYIQSTDIVRRFSLVVSLFCSLTLFPRLPCKSCRLCPSRLFPAFPRFTLSSDFLLDFVLL